MWKPWIGIVILVFFFCAGVAHVIYPDRFLRRSGMRKGGEMLTDFNRLGIRLAGTLFAAFSGFLLYVLFKDLLAH
jgi:hypothetical protein